MTDPYWLDNSCGESERREKTYDMGRSISRAEALQTARQILDQAEQERRDITEREAPMIDPFIYTIWPKEIIDHLRDRLHEQQRQKALDAFRCPVCDTGILLELAERPRNRLRNRRQCTVCHQIVGADIHARNYEDVIQWEDPEVARCLWMSEKLWKMVERS